MLDEEIRAAFEARTAGAAQPGPDPRLVYRRAVAESRSHRDHRVRRGRLLAAAAVVVAVGATVGLIAAVNDDTEPERVTTQPDVTTEDIEQPTSTMAPSPGAAEVGAPIELGSANYVKATGDAVWVSNQELASVTRLDPATGETVAIVEFGYAVSDLGTGDGSVWVAHAEDSIVTRIDASTNEIIDTYELDATADRLDYGVGAVWVASRETDTLTRLDPDTGALEAIVSDVSLPGHVEVMGEGVWVSTYDEGQVFHVDAHDNAVSVIDVGGTVTGLDADNGSVWVTGPQIGVVRIDPETDEIMTTIAVEGRPTGPNIGPRHVWVVTGTDCGPQICVVSVLRIDPATNQVIEEIPLPQATVPAGIWIGLDSVYVAGGMGKVIPIHIEGGP